MQHPQMISIFSLVIIIIMVFIVGSFCCFIHYPNDYAQWMPHQTKNQSKNKFYVKSIVEIFAKHIEHFWLKLAIFGGFWFFGNYTDPNISVLFSKRILRKFPKFDNVVQCSTIQKTKTAKIWWIFTMATY